VLELEASLQDFVLLALGCLGFEVLTQDDASFCITAPSALQHRFGSQSQRISFGDPTGDSAIDQVGDDSTFLRDLLAELKDLRQIPHAAPLHQPRSVREISQRLCDAYDVAGGSVHLSGCALEDRALLRITCWDRSVEGPARLCHRYVAVSGEELEPALIAGLQLEQAVPLPDAPSGVADHQQPWSDVSRRFVKHLGDESEWVLTTAIWCKYVEGKLAFVIGESMSELAFGGWAQLFANGSRRPPPFRCGDSGRSSYHLTATDDGRITAREAIGTCSQSGARVLASELVRCAVTGHPALPEYLILCPVSGERVLRDVAAACAMCQQTVSPAVLRAKHCTACRSLRPIRKDDPRMARLLGEYPRLDAWSRWRIAETARVYVLTASSLLRRLLVVVDKEHLEVFRLATRSRFSQRWLDAPALVRAEYLG